MVEISEAQTSKRCRGRPQVRCDDDTRALIVDAASREFQTKGYEATCIADVAGRAGVSTKTLYRLIPTKAELFADVISDRIRRFVLEFDVSPIDTLDAAAAIERMLVIFGTLALEPQTVALTRLVIGECRSFPEVGAAFYENAILRTTKAMEDGLRRLRDRGLIALDDPREAASMLRGMMVMEPQRAAMLGQIEPPDGEAIAARARRCARLFLDGCAAESRSRREVGAGEAQESSAGQAQAL
ncbi:TetR/AcrR family transcriptional regulator [Roseiarcus sp.]|jgi:AcrR family transcriptional regulator|uniref:TetR/AcrR family transcriptional regulator n=1 Tax=Roseiarcus sp. TaxID=1969460 RepID=UPI003F9B7F90